ncbi:unnamed protein product [Penicillium salamii]|uniref:Uncharacterized protein n=1 Tax=Penicillium salamii TaxID=1612424 RepID=A0A9W4NQP9_9EURO|nr:unnamed protein product [Penicillium salamii]CAG8244726.1 unnamed protein product [Penicillium salamii]CAG8399156.1 unnamed protein product [Penicillium salamii]
MDDPKLSGMRAPSDNVAIPRDLKFEVKWKDGDKENPRTWPIWYRSFIVAVMSLSTTIVYVYLVQYTCNRSIQ